MKRWRVFRAMLAYGVVAFAVLQIVEPIMHGLHWPDVVLSYVVVALAAGFPVTIAVAWAFDIRAGEAKPPATTAKPRSPAGLLLTGLGVAMAGAGGVWYFVVHRAPVRGEAERSVAVLPFANLSTEKDNEFFAEGVQSELITQLAKMSGLKVIARSSVQQYREGSRDLKAIGEALGVATLLEGSVQRTAGRIRITAQLVDANTSRELWADRYDRDLKDAFAIQTEVALDIAKTLGTKLSATENRLVERPPTADPEAYDLYLRGQYYWKRTSATPDADNGTAMTLFQKAVDRDPAFALAHSFLSQAASALKEPDCISAKDHADRAIHLQPDLPQAHAALGNFYGECRKDFTAAIDEYLIALKGAPNDADVNAWLASWQNHAGKSKSSLATFQRAYELDPRSTGPAYMYADALIFERRYDEAERVASRFLEMNSDDQLMMLIQLSIPMFRDGNLEPMRKAVDRVLFEHRSWYVSLAALMDFPEQVLALVAENRTGARPSDRFLMVAIAHFTLGHRADAEVAFETMLRQVQSRAKEATASGQTVPDEHLDRAFALAGLGRPEAAFSELSQARLYGEEYLDARAGLALLADRHDEAVAALDELLSQPSRYTVPYLRASRFFAPLHKEPGFEAMLAKHEDQNRHR